jgi:hypothetical protein
MIDIINDTLVSIRFSVNQNVHFEVLLVKIAEMVKFVRLGCNLSRCYISNGIRL